MTDEAINISEAVFCALDLETTGIDPRFHEIVEIGIIKFSLSGEIARYESRVNPGMPIPQEVVAIHGITDEMVADSPFMEEIIPEVVSFLEGSVLVIQNAGFDVGFLMKHRGLVETVRSMKIIDTLRMSRKAYPDIRSHGLKFMCAKFGIELDHHRAMSDAFGCMEIFRMIMSESDPQLEWRLGDIKKLHGRFYNPRPTISCRD
ncbi:MAG: 3'-5' exonuclease [Spirochaetes bacterium]|jgi:DNA polymerase III epsilon subunit family exonuclease|nr:3'-5' exonuclease [Spirochaetota bacterium]